jgi:hypothetical protein
MRTDVSAYRRYCPDRSVRVTTTSPSRRTLTQMGTLFANGDLDATCPVSSIVGQPEQLQLLLVSPPVSVQAAITDILAISSIDAGLRRLYHSIPQHLVCKIMPLDAYGPTAGSHRDSDTANPRHSIDGDSRPSMAPPPSDISDGSPKGQVEIQQIRLAQHFVMVFCRY